MLARDPWSDGHVEVNGPNILWSSRIRLIVISLAISTSLLCVVTQLTQLAGRPGQRAFEVS